MQVAWQAVAALCASLSSPAAQTPNSAAFTAFRPAPAGPPAAPEDGSALPATPVGLYHLADGGAPASPWNAVAPASAASTVFMTPLDAFGTPASAFAGATQRAASMAATPGSGSPGPIAFGQLSPAFSFGAALQAAAPAGGWPMPSASTAATPTLALGRSFARQAAATAGAPAGDGPSAAEPVPADEPALGLPCNVFGSPFGAQQLTPNEGGLTQLQMQLAGAMLLSYAGTPQSAEDGPDGQGSPSGAPGAAGFNLAALLAHLRSPRRLAAGTPHPHAAGARQSFLLASLLASSPDPGLGPGPSPGQRDSPATSEAASFGFSTAAKQMTMSHRSHGVSHGPGATFMGWHGAEPSGTPTYPSYVASEPHTPASFSFKAGPAGGAGQQQHQQQAAAAAETPSLVQRCAGQALPAAAASAPGSAMGFSFAALLQQLASPMPMARHASVTGRHPTATSMASTPGFSFGMLGGSPADAAAATPLLWRRGSALAAEHEEEQLQEEEEQSPHTPPMGTSPALSLYDWAALMHEASPALLAAGLSPQQRLALSPDVFSFAFGGNHVGGGASRAVPLSAATTPAYIGGARKAQAAAQPATAEVWPEAAASLALAQLLQNLRSPLPQPAAPRRQATHAGVGAAPSGTAPAAAPAASNPLPRPQPAAAPMLPPAAFWQHLLQELNSPMHHHSSRTAGGRASGGVRAMEPLPALQQPQAANDEQGQPSVPAAASSCGGLGMAPVVPGSAAAADTQGDSAFAAPPPAYEELEELTALGVCVPASTTLPIDAGFSTVAAASPLQACSSSVGENATPLETPSLLSTEAAAVAASAVTAAEDAGSPARLFTFTPRRLALQRQQQQQLGPSSPGASGSASTNGSSASSPAAVAAGRQQPLQVQSLSDGTGSPAAALPAGSPLLPAGSVLRRARRSPDGNAVAAAEGEAWPPAAMPTAHSSPVLSFGASLASSGTAAVAATATQAAAGRPRDAAPAASAAGRAAESAAQLHLHPLVMVPGAAAHVPAMLNAAAGATAAPEQRDIVSGAAGAAVPPVVMAVELLQVRIACGHCMHACMHFLGAHACSCPMHRCPGVRARAYVAMLPFHRKVLLLGAMFYTRAAGRSRLNPQPVRLGRQHPRAGRHRRRQAGPHPRQPQQGQQQRRRRQPGGHGRRLGGRCAPAAALWGRGPPCFRCGCCCCCWRPGAGVACGVGQAQHLRRAGHSRVRVLLPLLLHGFRGPAHDARHRRRPLGLGPGRQGCSPQRLGVPRGGSAAPSRCAGGRAPLLGARRLPWGDARHDCCRAGHPRGAQPQVGSGLDPAAHALASVHRA